MDARHVLQRRGDRHHGLQGLQGRHEVDDSSALWVAEAAALRRVMVLDALPKAPRRVVETPSAGAGRSPSSSQPLSVNTFAGLER